MAKKKWAGEDTRGAKAKAQKAASRAEKAAAHARKKEKEEAASWTDNVTDRKTNRRQAKEEKEMQRRAKLEAKRALLAAEEREMAGIKAKGKRRKAQLAAGSSTWGKKNAGGKVKSISMKAMDEELLKIPKEFIKEVLVSFYTQYNKEKLANVDKILKVYEKKWGKLEAGLRKKFPESAPNFRQLWEKRKIENKENQKKSLKGVIVNEEPIEGNLNHVVRKQKEEGVAVAFGIEDTISQLSNLTTGDAKVDRHPEKRRKALYRAYEEKQMAILRAEFPKLKRSQLKERIFDSWKKSPENPMNQRDAAV